MKKKRKRKEVTKRERQRERERERERERDIGRRICDNVWGPKKYSIFGYNEERERER